MSDWPNRIDGRGETTSPVVLAHELPFRLGALLVEPALRRVSTDEGAEEIVQPRTMQVLVSLARSEGRILSRDDLTQSCWSGTVVGDDSINRVIAQLRRLGEGIGEGRFTIETITRVGYRMVPAAGVSSQSLMERAVPDAQASVREPQRLPGPSTVPERKARLLPRRRWLALLVAPLVVGGALAWAPWHTPNEHTLTVARPTTIGLSTQASQVFEDEVRATLAENGIALSGEGKGLVAHTALTATASGVTLATTIEESRSKTQWTGEQTLPASDLATIGRAGRVTAELLRCGMLGANDASQPGSAVMNRWLALCATEEQGRQLQLAHEILQIDAGFAPAWLSIEQADGLIALDLAAADPAGVRRDGLAAFARFRALRPEAADGYAYAALLTDPQRPLERERLLRKASALKYFECPCALAFLGDFLIEGGRPTEAIPLYRRGLDAEPRDESQLWRLAMAAEISGQTSIADKMLTQLAALASPKPDYLHLLFRFRIAQWRHDWRGAEALAAKMKRSPEVISAITALASGNRVAMSRAAAGLANNPELDARADTIVPLLVQLGAIDAAFAMLDRNVAHNGRMSAPGQTAGLAIPALFDPNNRPLWSDPRFTRHLQRAGYIAYWRAAQVLPDACREASRPPFCAAI